MNFRKFTTTSGKIVLAGKSAETNEELIKQAGKEEYVLHTASPGSPFVNIKASFKEVSKTDIEEAAVFCVKYSQAWKKPKTKPKEIEVHVFKGKDIFKDKKMKIGTFGVKKFRKIIVERREIEKLMEKTK